MVAAMTRLGTLEEMDLAARLRLWDRLQRHEVIQTSGQRFRSDPKAYLKSFEDSLINQNLPSYSMLKCFNPNLFSTVRP